MSTPVEAWENFFQSCDLPANVCKSYAQRFVKERMQPYMLKEICKDELRELGITAMGDQLAILRYIKLCGDEMEVEVPAKTRFMAPDRDEIYHVKMPAGNTPKTKKILEKQSVLREKGLIKRGITGVRVAIRKQTKAVMIQDISSSSAMANAGSMRSDLISSKTTVVASTPTIRRPKVFTSDVLARNIGVLPQVQRVSTSSSTNPNFRVRLDINDINPASSIANRLSMPHKMVADRLQRVVANAAPQQQRLAQRMVGAAPRHRITERVVAVPVVARNTTSIRRAPIFQKRSNILNRISIRR
uniref:SAM domain-containing protein n=1 Tax=Ditylenchus dipsaci TaxID=166011 RepID=A0A915D880_9BILA